ncbi:acyl-protein synthetase [Pectobacterium brasiliense]|uniref:LuxE/PaaK family acyltransferase n=1 Tax=Pectobacterium brasiliense TaxID=180957 RepID=UPI001968DEC8|nr:acyl-protein synthetase [Pectobacterium brasiliense]MBN3123749.1 acyl-protein synthetase [Pectobacterium brasiliense]MBN3146360.1 acyl-protein synthetase [Pectobacterium brasiliense]QSD24275.1 acyl-protein synthetase [Pectobacterium brasiliense]
MNNLESVLSLNPFSMGQQEKNDFLTRGLGELTRLHYRHCAPYSNIIDALKFDVLNINSYYDIPFLPVSLFKELMLKSVPDEDVFKTMTSSGTTGQAVSRIYLDKATASNQQKVLVKIVSSFTESSRMPMLIIDSSAVVKNRAMFSARGAGILGFSIFGTDRTYALDDEMNINLPVIKAFLEKHKGKKILLFGFTFMVWQHFYKEFVKSGDKLDLSNGCLIHGGGWKKLASEAVSQTEFKNMLKAQFSLSDIHDYYGMVEQTGSIYMACEHGHLHASNYSDVIIRRPSDFSVCNPGETGIVQVVSILPQSYPGHSLLTEDEGVLLGIDDCPCGRKGKYFKINGRLQNAELRGCSDTYAARN